MNGNFYVLLRSKDNDNEVGTVILPNAGETRLEAELNGTQYAKEMGLVVEAVYPTINYRTANRSRIDKPTWKKSKKK